MQINLDDKKVFHNLAKNRFEIEIDHQLAILDYHKLGNTIIFSHTGVPPALEGNGIGSLLVKTGLAYAKEHDLRVQSSCWFVDMYLQRHPEYRQE